MAIYAIFYPILRYSYRKSRSLKRPKPAEEWTALARKTWISDQDRVLCDFLRWYLINFDKRIMSTIPFLKEDISITVINKRRKVDLCTFLSVTFFLTETFRKKGTSIYCLTGLHRPPRPTFVFVNSAHIRGYSTMVKIL